MTIVAEETLPVGVDGKVMMPPEASTVEFPAASTSVNVNRADCEYASGTRAKNISKTRLEVRVVRKIMDGFVLGCSTQPGGRRRVRTAISRPRQAGRRIGSRSP